MNKKLGVILAVALAVCLALLIVKRRTDLASSAPAEVLPVVAETVTLTQGKITLTTPAMAQVANDLSTTLSTRVTGRVLAVHKKQGDRVRKGEKLLSIDASDLDAQKAALRAKLEGLEYELAVQRENHDRTMRLFAIKGASLEQTRMEEGALNNLEKGKESLVQNIRAIDSVASYATLVAPVSGTVSELSVNSGDMAAPGKPLLRIAAGEGLYLSLALPDSFTPQGLLLNGATMQTVSRNQASSSGLIQYVAQPPENAGLIEGQYLNVRVVTYSGNGILVPMDGLLGMEGRPHVLVLENGLARKMPVTVLASGSEGAVVAEDLGGRTILVAKPDILLRAATGAPIKANARQGGTSSSGGGRADG